jgi:hypothetical protein
VWLALSVFMTYVLSKLANNIAGVIAVAFFPMLHTRPRILFCYQRNTDCEVSASSSVGFVSHPSCLVTSFFVKISVDSLETIACFFVLLGASPYLTRSMQNQSEV